MASLKFCPQSLTYMHYLLVYSFLEIMYRFLQLCAVSQPLTRSNCSPSHTTAALTSSGMTVFQIVVSQFSYSIIETKIKIYLFTSPISSCIMKTKIYILYFMSPLFIGRQKATAGAYRLRLL